MFFFIQEVEAAAHAYLLIVALHLIYCTKYIGIIILETEFKQFYVLILQCNQKVCEHIIIFTEYTVKDGP